MHHFGRLDEIWFIVSPQNPFKELKDLLSQEIRLNLVQKAIAYCDKFVASDIEFNMRIPSYTYDTMIRLAEIHPTYRFSIIMGGDTFQGIEKWKNYKELLNAFDIILYKQLHLAMIINQNHLVCHQPNLRRI